MLVYLCARNFAMHTIQFIINESEITAGTRGASLGPRAVEIEALKKNDDLFVRAPVHTVAHRNNALYDRTRFPLAKRIDAYSEVFADAARVVADVMDSGYFPLVISGDHGNAAGTIAGLKMSRPEQRMGVIWIDAHADMHSPYTTPSGNMHGMPLAICLNEDNENSRINDPDSETSGYWNNLKAFGDIAPKINYEDLVFFGVRDVEEPEVQLMQERKVPNYTVDVVKKRGVKKCVAEVLDKLNDCDYIYVSFDVDSMDPNIVSKGTGTPVKNGFRPAAVLEIMQLIIASGKVACLEIVEVNPLLDNKGNEMARTTYNILKELIHSIEKAASQR